MASRATSWPRRCSSCCARSTTGASASPPRTSRPRRPEARAGRPSAISAISAGDAPIPTLACTLEIRQQNSGQRGITKHQGGGVAFWPTRTWEGARRRTQQEVVHANGVPENGRSASTAVLAGGLAVATRLSRLGLRQTKRLAVLMPPFGAVRTIANQAGITRVVSKTLAREFLRTLLRRNSM